MMFTMCIIIFIMFMMFTMCIMFIMYLISLCLLCVFAIVSPCSIVHRYGAELRLVRSILLYLPYIGNTSTQHLSFPSLPSLSPLLGAKVKTT